MRFTVFSSTDCWPCRTAYKRLDAAGVDYDTVLLDQDADALADLKRRLGVDFINTPHIEYGSHRGGIAELSALITLYKEKNA